MADEGRPSELVYDTGLVGVGRFRLAPSSPRFADTGPIGGCLMVFPREAVTITHAGGAAIVADPATVMFYNHGQEYRRGALSPVGDACEWFALPADAVAAATRAHAPRPAEPDRPFGALTHGPCDAPSYLLQRALYEQVRRPGRPDRLLVEETILTLLDRLVGRAWATRRAPSPRAHADLADAARRLLAVRYDAPLSLAEIAGLVGASPFHLSRVFRRHSGRSLHALRTELRLRAAANQILGGATDLTRVALDLGFSSHSHLSSRFRSAFGVAPSRLRRLPVAALRAIGG